MLEFSREVWTFVSIVYKINNFMKLNTKYILINNVKLL